MNHANIPLMLPFRFVKNGDNGIHFNSQFAYQSIRFWERKAHYKQKWVKTDTTKLQIESSIFPEQLQVRSIFNQVIKSLPWTLAALGSGSNIYELIFDISDIGNDTYYLYQQVKFGDAINWEAISNPIYSSSSWPNTILIKYTNSYNVYDIYFKTGIELSFRIDADIQDWEPDTDRNVYKNQVRSATVLDSSKGNKFYLYIGDSPGVYVYMVDILDFIFCLDSVSIEGKFYTVKEGSNIKITRVRGYPLIGASLEIVPSINETSLQFTDNTPLPNVIITTYNIETAFFGPKSIIPVEEVEQNG